MLLIEFFSLPKAYAAENSWSSLETAKKAIQKVAPVIAPDIQPDETAASIAIAGTEDYIEKPFLAETENTRVVRAYQTYGLTSQAGVNHFFPRGYCTWYVSQKREITWSGNAGTWLNGAKSAGLSTGKIPAVGSIMVTSEGGRTGHVAYVEKIDGANITVSEMNFVGFGIISSRVVPADSRFIRGYVY